MENTKETYRIQYIDNTYQLVEWTDEDLKEVAILMSDNRPIAVVSKCIYRLSDIRAIVHIPPVPEEEEEEKQPMVVTEMGAYERELYEFLVESGYAPDMGDIVGEKGVKE